MLPLLTLLILCLAFGAAGLPARHCHQQRCGHKPEHQCSVCWSLLNACVQRGFWCSTAAIRSEWCWSQGIILYDVLECPGLCANPIALQQSSSGMVDAAPVKAAYALRPHGCLKPNFAPPQTMLCRPTVLCPCHARCMVP